MYIEDNKENRLFWVEGLAYGILSLSFVFLIIGLIGKHYPSYPFNDDKLTEYFTVILASITVLATIHEYHAHRKRIKAEVLGEYNERYSKDEHINKVVDYIIRYMDNNVVNPLPSVHDVEMFMRFFEEMEIQIEEKRLDEQQVFTLFAFYAIQLADDEIIRRKLGIAEDFKGHDWDAFKCFVYRMKKLKRNTEENRQNIHIPNTLPINEVYDKIIIDSKKWKYYDFNPSIKSFIDLYEAPDTFIKEFLLISKKNKEEEFYKILDALLNNEHNPTNGELNGRLRHVVSLFFWGHVLYDNIPAIKTNINQQFKQFIESGMFNEEKNTEENIHMLFSFMWFLLCIFHDFGYAYEKGLISEKQDISELDMPEGFKPDIYSKNNIEKYKRYRDCAFGCKDHGIYGGKVFYSGMLDIGRQIAIDTKTSQIFNTDKVDKVYQYAAWVISSHNIFYNKGNDKYTNCYKCQGLDCFINPKARCLTLRNNPLLFLFCFADSIEPTKILRSKTNDNKTDYEISKSLYMAFDKNKNTIRFDLSRIKCTEVQEKYMNNILGLNDWLIDISNDLTIIFE